MLREAVRRARRSRERAKLFRAMSGAFDISYQRSHGESACSFNLPTGVLTVVALLFTIYY